MPTFERDGVSLYYEEVGSGFPLLLFAPGGMRSNTEYWPKSPFDPSKEFAADFRVIAMDQRNAGRSHGPVSAADGWHTYAADHIALLDHLGIARCHTMGGCIGSSYCLSLIKEAPDRVSASILQNPIGLHENREAFRDMFDGWAKALQRDDSSLTDEALLSLRERMYGTDFVFSVTRDFVKICTHPLMVLAGDDLYHPAPISREIVSLAPNVEMVESWKTPAAVPAAVKRVRDFLKAHQ
jgi:pimeloyl-ACP methyl ester carboxylesterase